MTDPLPRPLSRGLIRPELSRRVARRALAIFAGCAAIVLAASPAMSQVAHPRDEEACQAALKDAKTREQEGALQAAKTLLKSCAQNPCSAFVRQQCGNRNTKLEMDTPTVVLLVTDAAGGARTDIQVRVDGEPFASQLDGRAVPIDPGMHDFSFITEGHVFATQKILIVQGQRNRFITATMGRTGRGAVAADETAGPSEEQAAKLPATRPRTKAPATAAADKKPALAMDESATAESSSAEGASPPKHRRILPWVLSGVGVAGLGAGAVLTLWGRKDNNSLSNCSPSCSQATLDHIRRVYQGADIAIGVGVAALAAAYWSYAAFQDSPGESHGSESALRLDVAPTTSGGFASVSGRF
jgi:hypothetical protein